MKVKKEHYIESINYLKNIASRNFYNELKDYIESLSDKYKILDDRKKSLEKEIKTNKDANVNNELAHINKELNDISNKLNEKLRLYRKDFFESHINRIVAYNENIDIEDMANKFILDINTPDREDYQIIKDAIRNLNSIAISPSILAYVYSCTRQNINTLLHQGELDNIVIGHITAFKLLDVIK